MPPKKRALLKIVAAKVRPMGRHVASDGLLMANDLYWNPIDDDGDAFRLMVDEGVDVAKLKLRRHAKTSEGKRKAVRRAIVEHVAGL